MKKETTFKPIFFSHQVTMLFLLKKINNIYKVKNLKKGNKNQQQMEGYQEK